MSDGMRDRPVVSLLEQVQGRVRELENENDALRIKVGKLERGYIIQDVAQEILEMFDAAGYGKPGTSNTIWGMTKAALKEVAQFRKCRTELRQRIEILRTDEWNAVPDETIGDGSVATLDYVLSIIDELEV